MPRAHQPLALDVAIGDPAAVVRALVRDHDQPARAEPSDRDRARAIAGREDLANAQGPQLVQLRATVVRVVAQLVEDLRLDRAHDLATVGHPSDSRGGR